MNTKISRRKMLRRTGVAVLISAGAPAFCFARAGKKPRWEHGAVVGENQASLVGQRILAEGGTAVDAAVAAAFAACVAAPSRSGIGGYGGHMILALDGGKRIAAIDFNTMAPAGAAPDMFPLDEKGAVKNRANFYGWRAAGVPGVPAGLELALKKYGTKLLEETLQPAIRIAREGIVIPKVLGNTLHQGQAQFAKDPGSAKLYFRNGELLKGGDIFRNPELAEMLSEFGKKNSVDDFYRGEVAAKIAEASEKGGGLLTRADLSAYHALDVHPHEIQVGEFKVLTAPLTAAGATTLEALGTLRELSQSKNRFSAIEKAHAALEALRLAWKDKVELLGDPAKVEVPIARLLSAGYAAQRAEQVRSAVRDKKPIDTGITRRPDDGTNNLCIVDRHGNMVAVTLTHGSSFGAQVTVDGLGLTLGHGMSRFDPRPGHPNSVGPGKRPVHNMAPSLVLRSGKPVLAVGCAGGTRIPNCIYDVLRRYLLEGAGMQQAVAAPRLHCIGTLDVALEPESPKDAADYLKSIGFKVGRWESSAVLSAVSFDPDARECDAAVRGPAILEIKPHPYS